jgi:hypothetical protein
MTLQVLERAFLISVVTKFYVTKLEGHIYEVTPIEDVTYSYKQDNHCFIVIISDLSG